MSVKHRCDTPNRFTHQLQPGNRQMSVRFRIIKRDDLGLECEEETGLIDLVLDFQTRTSIRWELGADGPSILAVVTFAPPTIEDTEVQTAVWRQLHAARSTRFKRTNRVVEPKINPLGQTTSNIRVVIFNKYDPVFKLRFTRDFVNLLDKPFPAFVFRMRFPCKYKLHRMFSVAQHPTKPVQIGEQQRATLVCRKPSGKADCQNFRIQNAVGFPDVFRGFTKAGPLIASAFAGDFDEPLLKHLMGFPEFLIRNIDYATPEIGFHQMFFPVAQIFVVKGRELRSHPGLGMNPVGDAGNRHFLFRNASPHIFPEAAAHVAMKRTDAVGVTTGAERQDGHAERFMRIGPSLTVAEERLDIEANLSWIIVEILTHHIQREGVVACRNRGVRGENVTSSNSLKRSVEVELLLVNMTPDQFEREER